MQGLYGSLEPTCGPLTDAGTTGAVLSFDLKAFHITSKCLVQEQDSADFDWAASKADCSGLVGLVSKSSSDMQFTDLTHLFLRNCSPCVLRDLVSGLSYFLKLCSICHIGLSVHALFPLPLHHVAQI